MGFKCPICFEDFQRDKKKWDQHVGEQHNGIGKDFKQLLRKITKPKEIRNAYL